MATDLISPSDAVKMIFPFDVPGIRAEFAKMLGKPASAAFIKELLERVSENAAPDNTLVAGGDILKIFDLIQSQRGLIRAGDKDKGAIDGANFAIGRIATGNAAIQIGNFRPGTSVTLEELTDLYLKSDARFALHETIHHAGKFLYSDQELAVAVSAMLDNVPPLPTSGDRLEFSKYWDKELRKRCQI